MNLSAHFNWKTALLVVWVAFSFAYISYNMFDSFRNQALQGAYIGGKTDTINALIAQAQDKECKPFNVYSGDRKVDLINVACLQQAPKETINAQ